MTFRSFGEILQRRALSHRDAGYTYLVDGEQEESFLSYTELDAHARSVAKVLRERGLSHKQVILLFPPGLEFISALFGCFYEGVVAVPLAPPNPKRLSDELRRMAILARDARASAVLTTQMFYAIFQSLPDIDPAITGLNFVLFEDAIAQPALDWEPPRIDPDRLAFLQYTSGSTGIPKGVLVTHENLIANSLFLQRSCQLDEHTIGVSWLPTFHDFGLIGFVLQPVFIGGRCTIMSPLAFLQRPARWLQAISRYRATSSGAPNFAFELCVRRITDAECESLDLSSWQIAQCAAEPVRKSTLERFAQRFAPYGFRAATFSPCYGLAESTLLTTASPAGRGMMAIDFSAQALQEGRAQLAQPGESSVRTLVALGHADQVAKLAVVSLESGSRLPDCAVGEIWLQGPSVTAGYFGKPEQTAQTFHAELTNEPGSRYLRTGDLGFVYEGELFMTGRLKDLLIVAGRNHYPQDLEFTVESVSASLRAGCSIAFSMERDDEEVAVVVAELAVGTEPALTATIGAAIRQAISEQHGLSLHTICLAAPGSVPKTSSGKLQRSRCRENFVSGKIQPLWQWSVSAQPKQPDLPVEVDSASRPTHAPTVSSQAPASPQPIAQESSLRRTRIERVLAWLHKRMGQIALSAGTTLDPDAPLAAYGLDSVKLVGLSGELSEQLGEKLSPTFFFDHPTLTAIARALWGTSTHREFAADASASNEPIAIIGMACRWPGGISTPASYWQLLASGQDAIAPFPSDRWDVAALYDPDPGAVGKTYCKHGGFLSGLDQFDASFFGIAPREAMSMEPQQRLVLETAWEAIESARIPPSRLSQSVTGVYIGSQGSDYNLSTGLDDTLLRLDGYMGTGQASSVLSGRVSYTLNLQGPAITVDTACSSSLVALHLACEGLRRGDCDLTLAGGVQVMNTPAAFVEFSRLRGLAPDGRCKSFGARADGTGWSEGCGVLLLKRLSDATRDGNSVLALIRGTAINQDGRSQGLTAPNGPAQERVIRRALAVSGLQPVDIDTIEAHGTGTQLGDPIEASALTAVFASGRAADLPLHLGSCKSNLGHTQAAAGIAGVMKMVLSLQHERLPQTLHAETPSPHIHWDQSPLRLLSQAVPWPRGTRTRRAGVSSFGISGTNAHVVIEEAPTPPETPSLSTGPEKSSELVVLSGRSEAAIRGQAALLRQHLQTQPAQPLAGLAFSLATTRTTMEHRLAIVSDSHERLLDQLASVEKIAGMPGVQLGRAVDQRTPMVVFVFPGQGSQWLGMGRSLLAGEPVFRSVLTACDAMIAAEAGFSVLAELAADEASSQLHRIEVVQPVLFAMSVALAALWRSWGVEPDAVVGHSMGEIAAAHVAGALSLADAVAVICRRSHLLKRISGQGEMALVELSVAEAEQEIAGYAERVSVAVSNSPRSTVLSGDAQALAEIMSRLSARQVFCRRVNVDVASHSPQVDLLRDELMAALAKLSPGALSIPMRSTVSGELLQGTELSASYWVLNLRQTVRFADTVRALLADEYNLFVEVSPHPLLVPALEELVATGKPGATVVGSLRRSQPERAALLSSLGGLWLQGCPVAWDKLFPTGGRRLDLPTYAWQRQRHWRDTASRLPESLRTRGRRGGHPLLGEVLRLSSHPGTLLWDTLLFAKSPAWIDDHKLRGAVVFPAAGQLDMALVAGSEAFGSADFAITNLELIDALVLPADTTIALQVETWPQRPRCVNVQVSSRRSHQGKVSFRIHSRAVLQRVEPEIPPTPMDVATLKKRMPTSTPSRSFYAALATMGLELGSSFQGLRELWLGDGEALGRVVLPDSLGSTAGYVFHPALLDACLQLMAACFSSETEHTPWVPVGLERFRLHQKPSGELFCHVQVDSGFATAQNRRRAMLCVSDVAGTVVAQIDGLVVQRLGGSERAPFDDFFVSTGWQFAQVAAPKLNAARWLLIGQAQGLAASLKASFVLGGHSVVHVPQLPPHTDATRDLLVSCFQRREPTGVVLLSSMDEDPSQDDIQPALLGLCESVIRTVGAISTAAFRDVPRLWVLTQGAQSVAGEAPCLLHAPLLGLTRTVALEHPELRCARLDLDPKQPGSSSAVAAIVAELLADESEEEIALRNGQRYVSRLVRRLPQAEASERLEPAQGRPFRLEMATPGELASLRLRATTRRPPGPGEIELSVEASAVPSEDIQPSTYATSTTATVQSAPWSLSGACTGRVVAVGPDVTKLAPGDAVVTLASGVFASHLTCSASLALPMPTELDFPQATALAASFVPAHYALTRLAQLAAGERILIHGATSAVGLAAVQWAQQIGASVYATASTAEERTYLQSIGVRVIGDARSEQFVDELRKTIEGPGIDVVFHCQAGAAIAQSLDLLAEHGRLVTMGPPADGENLCFDLRLLQRNVSIARIDLSGLIRNKSDQVRFALQELVTRFASGVLSPPPVRPFSIEDAADAFRTAAQTPSSGQIVLRHASAAAKILVPIGQRIQVRKDGSYLIAGGLGGLGLSIAGWLAEQRAGQIILLSRTDNPSAAQLAAIAALRTQGSVVRVTSCDIADRPSLESVLRDISESDLPLRGVIHAAGLLDDGLLAEQTPQRLAHVLRPKVLGGWNLHQLTKALPLDFFVLYGSAAGLLGSPGQANYASANSFLDALARYRRAHGLPALCIEWGAFSDVGLAAQQQNRAQRLELRGMRSLKPEEGLQILGRLLVSDEVSIGVVPLNLRQWGAFHQVASASARFSALRSSVSPETPSEGDHAFETKLRALPAAKRAGLIADHLRAQVAQVLRIAESQVELDTPLTSLGLDSLMGLELRNRVESMFGIKVPATLLWTYPTLLALSGQLAKSIVGAEPEDATQEAPTSPPRDEGPKADEMLADEDALFALLDESIARAESKVRR